MFKIISKVLIITLVIQFALLLPFESIWLQSSISKIKAQDAGPVAPTNPTLLFKTSSTTYNDLRVYTGEKNLLTFNGSVSINNDNFSANQVPSYQGNLAGEQDIIKLFPLSNPILQCGRAVGYDATLTFFAVATKYHSDPTSLRFSGIYYGATMTTDPPTSLVLATSRIFLRNGACSNVYDNYQEESTAIMTANSLNTSPVISVTIGTSERETTCNDIKSNWDNMRDSIRDLFVPVPRSEGSDAGNIYWIIRNASQQDEMGETYYMVLEKIMDAVRSGVFNDNTGDNYDDTANAIANKLIFLNNDGIAKLRDIIEYGKMIQEKGKTITTSDNPTCPNIIFKKFKWDKTLEETENASKFANLEEFLTAIKSIADAATVAYQNTVDARTPESNSKCPGLISINTLSGGIFDVLFCMLAEWTHGLSSGVMERASRWLLDSIGVDTSNGGSPRSDSATNSNAGQVDQTDQGTERYSSDDVPESTFPDQEQINADMLD